MGFSFCLCQQLRSFLLTGPRPATTKKEASVWPKLPRNALGRQTGCVNTQAGANRNGFVSRMARFEHSSELLAERLSCRKGGRTKARRYKPRTKQTLLFAADRPAGTREALPGTMLRSLRLASDN